MNLTLQMSNISFLLLLGSMICYWLGPLSLNIYSTAEAKANSRRTINHQVIVANANLAPCETLRVSNPNPEEVREQNNFSKPEKPSSTFFEMLFKNFNLNKNLEIIGYYSVFTSNLLLIFLLVNRWIESGHFPLSNLFESLMFLSWCFTTLHLILEKTTSNKLAKIWDLSNFLLMSKHKFRNDKTKYSVEQTEQNEYRFIGAITTPSALFTNAFATLTLPKQMQESTALVPALQSNWLMMHVTVMIISYAALILGSLLAITFLVITTSFPSQNLNMGDTSNSMVFPKKPKLINYCYVIDNLSYRILGIGFPFLTIGILSGAVWANEAWGSYWSWDPKETWALLTWLIYAIYLHTRLNKGWEGKKPAIIASVGFLVVWICYLGVNLIGEGLHSYGWFD